MHRIVPCLNAMELGALGPWLFEPAKESGCKVADHRSHVQRVLNNGVGKLEKDPVILGEEKDEITFVDEGHDVEHVIATHMNLYRYEIYRRDARGKLRLETWRAGHRCQGHAVNCEVRSEIEESTSDVIDFGLVSHPMTSCGEKCSISISRPADCRMRADDVYLRREGLVT